MTTLETLKAARAKIADAENWTTGELCSSEDGSAVPPESEAACKWCALGAIYAVDGAGERAGDFMDTIAGPRNPLGWRPLAEFNDTHTHAEVLALFDKAIASLEAA